MGNHEFLIPRAVFFFITLQELFCTSWIFNITRLSYKYAGFYFAGADYVLLEV